MAGTFHADVRRWVQAAKGDVDKVVRKVVLDLGKAIIYRTPIDTGRLVGNWQFGTDEYPTTAHPNWSTHEDAVGQLASQTAGITAGHVHYIVNNMVYAGVVEYGGYPNPPKGGSGKTVGGFSTQAPQGMVRVTVLEYQTYLEKAVMAVKSGQ